MCRSHHAVETRLHEERKAHKKLQKDMNEVKKALYPNKTPSPQGSKERESNPPTPFGQRYVNYENFDPLHPFSPYASTSHMGFDSQLDGDFGQQGPTFDAPPPPHPPEHQDLAWQMSLLLVSLVIQIPVWLAVPTSLFIIVLCHHSLTHLCTPGQDRIGLHHMISPRQMINRRQGLNLLRTPFFSFFL
jgi:hypothetical protein